jgi:hypothetical protein
MLTSFNNSAIFWEIAKSGPNVNGRFGEVITTILTVKSQLSIKPMYNRSLGML